MPLRLRPLLSRVQKRKGASRVATFTDESSPKCFGALVLLAQCESAAGFDNLLPRSPVRFRESVRSRHPMVARDTRPRSGGSDRRRGQSGAAIVAPRRQRRAPSRRASRRRRLSISGRTAVLTEALRIWNDGGGRAGHAHAPLDALDEPARRRRSPSPPTRHRLELRTRAEDARGDVRRSGSSRRVVGGRGADDARRADDDDRGRRADVPHVRQTHNWDCGLAALHGAQGARGAARRRTKTNTRAATKALPPSHGARRADFSKPPAGRNGARRRACGRATWRTSCVRSTPMRGAVHGHDRREPRVQGNLTRTRSRTTRRSCHEALRRRGGRGDPRSRSGASVCETSSAGRRARSGSSSCWWTNERSCSSATAANTRRDEYGDASPREFDAVRVEENQTLGSTRTRRVSESVSTGAAMLRPGHGARARTSAKPPRMLRRSPASSSRVESAIRCDRPLDGYTATTWWCAGTTNRRDCFVVRDPAVAVGSTRTTRGQKFRFAAAALRRRGARARTDEVLLLVRRRRDR